MLVYVLKIPRPGRVGVAVPRVERVPVLSAKLMSPLEARTEF